MQITVKDLLQTQSDFESNTNVNNGNLNNASNNRLAGRNRNTVENSKEFVSKEVKGGGGISFGKNTFSFKNKVNESESKSANKLLTNSLKVDDFGSATV